MKLLKSLVGVVLLATLSGGALAELKLVKREEIALPEKQRARGEPPEMQRGYLKLVSDDGRQYWAALTETSADLKKISYFLQIENFFDGGSRRRVALDKPLDLAYVPFAPQQSIPVVGTITGEWSVIKLNKELTKAEKTSEIKSMLLVGTTTKVGDKYLVGGQGKDKRPILVKMSADLKIERELKVPSKTEGWVGSIFVRLSGKYFITLDFTDGSEIWELSPDLSPLKKIKLPGLGAQGIPLRDGGFAVTYISIPDMDVFIERFNSSGQSVWKKKALAKSRPFTGFTLVELQDGLGLVVGNDERLLVARIDANGQRVRIIEDTRSGLRVPTHPDHYLVGVQGNNIHIRGVAPKPDSGSNIDPSSTSFHFVETP